MAVLNSDSLKHWETQILKYKHSPKTTPYGFPVSLVSDLLETLRVQRMLKKRYQRLAERRGQIIAEVFSLTSRAISENDQ